MARNQKFVPIVAVLNMKGGVGKTTLSANLFREMHRSFIGSAKTLLIDFDAQFNLTQLLVTGARYETLQTAGKTIWSILEPSPNASVFATSANSALQISSVFNYTEPLESLVPVQRELHLLPGDFRLSHLNLRENPEDLRNPRERFRQFVQKAKEECTLVVLDCNPSSSFLTRCAIEIATHLLVPIRPDKFSILGLKILNDYVTTVLKLPVEPQFFIVLNGVDQTHSTVETEIRADLTFGPRVLAARIRRSEVLAAKPGYTGFASDRRGRWARVIQSSLHTAATELQTKLGLQP